MKRRLTFLLLISVAQCVFAQNQVLSLNGDGAYARFSEALVVDGDFTIELWFKVDGPAGGTEQQSILFSQQDGDIGCYNSAIVLFERVRDDFPFTYFSTRTDQACSQRMMTEPPPSQGWHHIAAAKSVGVQKIYIDGRLVSAILNDDVGSYSTNLTSIDIGRHFQDGLEKGFFNGLIDEFRIWDYGLTTEEVLTSMTSTPQGSENGLVAYLNFDDGTGSDITGNGNDCEFINDASIIVADIEPYSEGVHGDLNQDGVLTISDVIILVERILGLE